MTLDRRQALSSGAAAALGVGGAAVPTRASEAPAASGPGRETEIQRLCKRARVLGAATERADARGAGELGDKLGNRKGDVECKILATPAETFGDVAVKAALAANIAMEKARFAPLPDSAPEGCPMDDHVMLWRVAQDLDRLAGEG